MINMKLDYNESNTFWQLVEKVRQIENAISTMLILNKVYFIMIH